MAELNVEPSQVRPLIWRGVLRRLPEQLREDVVQAAHVAALEGGPVCRVFGAAVDEARKLTGRDKHGTRHSFIGFNEYRTELIPDVDETLELAEAASDREAVRRAIATLPHRWRSMVTLYYFGGLEQEEIGTMFGVTESRVCQILRQARRQLRERLMDFR